MAPVQPTRIPGPTTSLEQADSLAAQAESLAVVQVQLGLLYEQHGRLDDAEQAFAKAIEIAPGHVRTSATDHLRRVIRKQQSKMRRYIWSPLRTAWTTWLGTLSAAVFSVALLGLAILFYSGVLRRPLTWIGKRRGRRQLTVRSLEEPPPAARSRAFVKALVNMQARMQVYARRRLLGVAPTAPVLVPPRRSEFIELLAGAAPGALARLLTRVASLMHQPEYTISGAVETGSRYIYIVVVLDHGDTTVQVWDRTFRFADWVEGRKDLAYEVLIFLRRYAASADAP